LDELLFGALPGDGFTIRYRPTPRKGEPEGGTLRAALEAETTGEKAASAAETGVPLKIQRLHRDAQFHVNELRKLWGAAGQNGPQVEMYVCQWDDGKKVWFGGGSTDVTDVYTPTVHITGEAWPPPTLRHELVHALASGVAYHGLGFHPNMAFTEGLAVA